MPSTSTAETNTAASSSPAVPATTSSRNASAPAPAPSSANTPPATSRWTTVCTGSTWFSRRPTDTTRPEASTRFRFVFASATSGRTIVRCPSPVTTQRRGSPTRRSTTRHARGRTTVVSKPTRVMTSSNATPDRTPAIAAPCGT